MSYREIAPSADLAPFVQCFWTYAAEGDGSLERIVPDGLSEVVVHLGDPYEEQMPEGRFTRQPRALFAGQLTRPLVLRNTGHAHVACVRFTPAGAASFFNGPMSGFTDRRVSLAELWDGSQVASLVGARDPGMAIGALTEILRVRRVGAPDKAVVEALRLMVAAGTGLTPGQIAERVELSMRQLQRRFAREIGVSPQAYAAVLRFRRVFDEVEQAGQGWLQAGLASGYFDQPQLARDFRRFLGCTATAFARECAGLAAPLSAARG